MARDAESRGRSLDAVLVVDKPVGPDVVRRRPAGAARGAARGGSGTAARSIRWPPGCCRSAWARRPSSPSFCSTPTRQYDFTVCFGVETDTDDAAGTVTAQPRRGRRRRGGRARARWRRSAARSAGAARCTRRSSGRGGRSTTTRAPARPVEAAPRGGGRARAGADVVRRPGGGRAHDALLEGDVRAGAGARSRARAGRGRPRDRAAPDALGAVLARGGAPAGRRCWRRSPPAMLAALPLVAPADALAAPRTAGS